MLQRISLDSDSSYPLWNAQCSQEIELAALSTAAQPRLMHRAGQGIAQLARAIAPHAKQAWVLCGPGNNGGDGLAAAHHLAQHGLTVWIHWFGDSSTCSPDTLQAWHQARSTHARWLDTEAIPQLTARDVWIDALLGLGQKAITHTTPPPIAQLLHKAHTSPAHTLAVDLPTGLDCDSGHWLPGYAPPYPPQAASRHTLSLLTLKPGLFTAYGRDACGHIWWDDLGCSPLLQQYTPNALLNASIPSARRPHNSHKGSFGDVLVIGGTTGMKGAAILAASAALHHGAGRTLLHLLDQPQMDVYTPLPDLMLPSAASTREHLSHATVVCGCGAGLSVGAWLPDVLTRSLRLVLDADALNALARQPELQTVLHARHAKGQATVLTPHPLEAARLLQNSVQEVQANRLLAAQTLADRLQSTVLLKGSGSIIASPGQIPHINPTGNARLATGGTGDVLAGMVAARWQSSQTAHQAASQAAWEHGALADQWPTDRALTASQLAQAQLGHPKK